MEFIINAHGQSLCDVADQKIKKKTKKTPPPPPTTTNKHTNKPTKQNKQRKTTTKDCMRVGCGGGCVCVYV